MLKFIIPMIVGVFSFFIIKYNGRTDYKGHTWWNDRAGNLRLPDYRKSFFK